MTGHGLRSKYLEACNFQVSGGQITELVKPHRSAGMLTKGRRSGMNSRGGSTLPAVTLRSVTNPTNPNPANFLCELVGVEQLREQAITDTVAFRTNVSVSSY